MYCGNLRDFQPFVFLFKPLIYSNQSAGLLSELSAVQRFTEQICVETRSLYFITFPKVVHSVLLNPVSAVTPLHCG